MLSKGENAEGEARVPKHSRKLLSDKNDAHKLNICLYVI